MRSRYAIHEAHSAYFVTSTIVEWLPVFTSAACCDILVHSLLHCREHKGLQIHAWVILDNHFHAILSAPDLAGSLTDLKRFTSRALLNQIKAEKREWLLNQLAYYCAAHKKGSAHQVWQEGLHPQAISGDEMMQQKLDYLHHNPVKRGLVSAPEHWRYSSACEWLPVANPLFKMRSVAVAGRGSNRVALTSAFPNRVWERGDFDLARAVFGVLFLREF